MTYTIDYKSELVPGFLGLKINKHVDHRGSFHRFFCAQELNKYLFDEFLVNQINISYSALKGTFRGFHFQDYPRRERKIIAATSGSFLDIVININKESESFGSHDFRFFSAEDGNVIFVSNHCAHAILSLEDNSTAVYLSDTPYTPELERGINPFDSTLGLPSDILEKIKIVSDKDKNLPSLSNFRSMKS